MQAESIFETNHRWTADEYFAMNGIGLFEGQRVELLDGHIVDMTAQGNPHGVTVTKLQYEFFEKFGKQYATRTQSSLKLGPRTVPEPDFAVLRGNFTAFDMIEPGAADILLLVEVADTSLTIDQKKAYLYARCAVPEYWIVDLNTRVLHVYRDPVVTNGSSHYGTTFSVSESSTVSPLFAPEVKFELASFLPQMSG
jgi:Uma2 family endonuclease